MSKQTFHYVGFYEEVWDAEFRQFLGTRSVKEQNGREFSFKGEQELTITKPIELTQGHKTTILKASKQKPKHIFTRLFPVCGRMISTSHEKS